MPISAGYVSSSIVLDFLGGSRTPSEWARKARHGLGPCQSPEIEGRSRSTWNTVCSERTAALQAHLLRLGRLAGPAVSGSWRFEDSLNGAPSWH